jgi:hypothetical protein
MTQSRKEPAMVKYEGPLAPNENGVIIWPDNLAWLQELSEGTLIRAMAERMARTEEDRARDREIREEYNARWQYLEDKTAELTGKYPDQWVGLGGDWELMVADSHCELLKKIDARSARPPQPVTKLLRTQEPRWIL